MNLTIPQFTPAMTSPRSTMSIPTISKPALKVPQLQRSGNVFGFARERTTAEIIAGFNEDQNRIAGLVSAEINLLKAKKKGGIHWNADSTGAALQSIQTLLDQENKAAVAYVRDLIQKQRAL
ncbi:MAG: hypothetical protein ACK551_01830 [Vampirovibrionales bacterium]